MHIIMKYIFIQKQVAYIFLSAFFYSGYINENTENFTRITTNIAKIFKKRLISHHPMHSWVFLCFLNKRFLWIILSSNLSKSIQFLVRYRSQKYGGWFQSVILSFVFGRRGGESLISNGCTVNGFFWHMKMFGYMLTPRSISNYTSQKFLRPNELIKVKCGWL